MGWGGKQWAPNPGDWSCEDRDTMSWAVCAWGCGQRSDYENIPGADLSWGRWKCGYGMCHLGSLRQTLLALWALASFEQTPTAPIGRAWWKVRAWEEGQPDTRQLEVVVASIQPRIGEQRGNGAGPGAGIIPRPALGITDEAQRPETYRVRRTGVRSGFCHIPVWDLWAFVSLSLKLGIYLTHLCFYEFNGVNYAKISLGRRCPLYSPMHSFSLFL